MSPHLCSCCEKIFTGPQSLRLELPHHKAASDLIRAADSGCYICGIIARSSAWKSIDPGVDFKPIWYLAPLSRRQTSCFKLTIDAAPTDEELDRGMMLEDTSDDSQLGSAENDEETFRKPEAPMWAFYLQPAADVEGCVAQSEIPSGLHDARLLHLAKRWLSECTDHSRCRASLPDFRPTRLVEIVSRDQARVVVTQQEPSIDLYASLSHCWGNSKRLKLETTNIDELRAKIRIGELPNTYREAITICIGLDIRYIWIDSLCIVQDSRDDWQREALTMKDVYQNSTVNIAAAASTESTQPSFLSRDLQMIRPLEVSTHWFGQKNLEYYLTNAAIYEDEVERAPLRQRAWVLQEIWLARRNLFLTKNQLWWECCEREACESYPNGVPEAWLSASWLEGHDESSTQQETRWGKLSFVHQRWDSLVETYTSCKITFPSDRIMAFAGIQQHFEEVMPNDDCMAGHWRSRLPQSLTWASLRGRWSYRPVDYRAPSWSWVSMEGPVRFEHNAEEAENGLVEVLCKLLDVKVLCTNPTGGGDLKGGWLTLAGNLTRVGCFNAHLTVQKPDGSFGFIEGSTDDPSDRISKDNWTVVEFDENTKSGEPAGSYLNGLSRDALLSGEFATLPRKVVQMVAWDKKMYSLPIIKWRQEETDWSRGLILCEAVVESQRVFQRIGSFTTSGSVLTSKLMESPQQEIIMI
ncbi:heterokaryon incompatibility protein-domain-containing protein [Amylocarpus encephaloides]|uniref:Heterokaryon incompatibility protein-domain-containing protein n=1 Tax=Amylocarpus encephaloides TaxID=45428 RepID=A0A9P7Y9D4_9HELO|nr:heterokaryon incompatibility protein-domain-containing protein [Amylocarpus encephaloides]